jgi:hypothetical protein
MIPEFYGIPNAAPFWHWATLFHFGLVALAGGMAFVTAIAGLRDHPRTRTYALVAIVLILLDLATLWLESPARFRFTHVWIFLSFEPTSPIWLGAWGLTVSLLTSLLLWLKRGPRMLWSSILVATSSMALIYPGLALAVNTNRPMWLPLITVLFPLTAMVTVVALALLFRQAWARRWLVPLSLASVLLSLAYLFGLYTTPIDAGHSLAYFWDHGGPLFVLGLAFLLAPVLVRRFPFVIAVAPLVGATIVRSLIVEIGQHQGFGF